MSSRPRCKAARCIGDGLYGVDLKETKDGVFVIEVNDNPNLDHGWEDSGREGRGLDPTDPVVPRPAGPAGTVADVASLLQISPKQA